METAFNSIFDNGTSLATATTIDVGSFITCILVSLVIGLVISLAYVFKTKCSTSFITTIALIPAVVCVVIMMVNGNIGTGIAVAGAFALVRFRSAPGTAKEIAVVFLAMCAGLIMGMGYIGFACLYTAIMSLMLLIYSIVEDKYLKSSKRNKILRITIPENLDYSNMFDDILNKYTNSFSLEQVKTTNMGTMFKLKHFVRLKDASKEKEMVDAIRERNGNLEVSMATIGLEKEVAAL